MDSIIRKAHTIDVGSIFAIMNTVALEMVKSDLFLSDDINYITGHIETLGITFVSEIDGNMAGFLAVDIPNEQPNNLGLDIDLTQAELSKVALMDSIVVSPDFRGMGLQKKLLKYAEGEMKSQGYTHFMATVHPDNSASLKSFLALGYEIKATKLKYDGLLRHILYKNADTI